MSFQSLPVPCLLVCLAMTTGTHAQSTGEAVKLETSDDQASYAIGLNIGRDLKANGVPLNFAAILLGIKDSFTGAAPRLTDRQAGAALQVYQGKVEQYQRLQAAKNRQAGAEFLAASKAQPGVTTLSSGLQYKVLKKGTGATPKLSDTVIAHYHGTFIDGTVFDSSVQRNKPAEFAVGGVIRGWTEALQLMHVGDKWRLFIPSDLAYGPRGRPGIPPHSTLIFDVELLGIK